MTGLPRTEARTQLPHGHGRNRLVVAAAVFTLTGGAAYATDNVSIVVPKAVGTGQKDIGAFG